MSEPGESEEAGAGDQEPVGSAAAEAAKLFAALSGLAHEQGTEYAEAAAGAASSVSDALGDLSAHIATGGEDCTYCPVCQTIHLVRRTSPEVRAHLAAAATSLLQAAAGLMATQVPDPSARATGVEKIDLDDEADESP